jgi:hypothetical protein
LLASLIAAGTRVAITAIVQSVRSILSLSILAAGASAHAELPPIPPPDPVPAAPEPPPAADPLPGHESGRTDPSDDGDSTMRAIGRDALFLPKIVFDTALQPVRAGLWAWDRYRLEDLYYRIFFNDARTIGITPTVGYDYGYGVDGVYGGARFVARDLFGEHEHLVLEAATGMQYRQLYAGELRTGDRLGKSFVMTLSAGFEQRPEDPFYGVGNGNLVAAPAMPVDPRVDDTAVLARYRQQRARVAMLAEGLVWRDLRIRGGAALTDTSFATSDIGMPIGTLYDMSGLVGWSGVTEGYGELELRWDSRRRTSVYEPRAVYARGSLVSVFGGRDHNWGAADFWRYGFDAQEFFRIGEGPRVLITRLHTEAVTGSRDEVPFTELPRLGGLTYLRGYALDRFRDRFASFGSLEYEWDLAYALSASVFVDAGRVYNRPSDAIDQLRVGYGFGIEAHSANSFVMQASLASSIDGGLMFNLAFNPVLNLTERVRRQ